MSSDTLAFAAARRQSRASLTATWLDGGTIEIYTAPRPASADAAPGAAVLLCILDLADPAGTVADGIITLALPESQPGLEYGAPAWARIRDAAGAAVGDVDAGLTDTGAAVEVAAAIAPGVSVIPTGVFSYAEEG